MGDGCFFENQLSNQLIIAHYDCFIKVDVFCYTIEHLIPSMWTRELLIIKDAPDQVLNQLVVKSAKKKHQLSMDELVKWQTKFLAYYHEVYRRAQRNESYYTLDCVDKMRQLVVMGWCYQDGHLPNSFGDWSKYQGVRSKLTNSQQEQLTQFFVNQDLNQLASVMIQFSMVFLSICEKIETKQRLPYSQHECSRIFEMVEFSHQA